MPFVDTSKQKPWERLPGWEGRFFRSDSMSFAIWEFKAGSSVHEHHHPNEEVWIVIEGELEVTTARPSAPAPRGRPSSRSERTTASAR